MYKDKVEISPFFLLLIAILHFLDSERFFLLWLGFCALHELGHILALKILNKKILKLKITVRGAELEVENSLSYCEEFLSAISGPAVNLLLAFLFKSGNPLIVGINIAIFAFNMLPIRLLDGGRALFCLLALWFGDIIAAKTLDFTSSLVFALLFGLGFLTIFLYFNPLLLIFSLFLFFSQRNIKNC